MRTFVKMILPAVAFALASAGAVSTNTSKTVSGAVQGWNRIAPNNCEPLRMCNALPGPACKAGIITVYAKPGLDCFTPLSHDTTKP